MAKNLCGKTRGLKEGEKPYEVWVAGEWRWEVLKKYQADDNKPYARAFCKVTSPMTFGSYDLGDVYIADYKSVATQIAKNY